MHTKPQDILVEEAKEDDYDSADEYDDELYKGPADKAEIIGKSELEREMILAERHDRKQRRIETLQIRAELRAKNSASQKQKSKATAAPSSSRARAATSAQDDKKAKLAELAQKRQHTKDRQREERQREDEEAEEEARREAARREAAASGDDDDDDRDPRKARDAKAVGRAGPSCAAAARVHDNRVPTPPRVHDNRVPTLATAARSSPHGHRRCSLMRAGHHDHRRRHSPRSSCPHDLSATHRRSCATRCCALGTRPSPPSRLPCFTAHPFYIRSATAVSHPAVAASRVSSQQRRARRARRGCRAELPPRAHPPHAHQAREVAQRALLRVGECPVPHARAGTEKYAKRARE